jgi:hypothetical protein
MTAEIPVRVADIGLDAITEIVLAEVRTGPPRWTELPSANTKGHELFRVRDLCVCGSRTAQSGRRGT